MKVLLVHPSPLMYSEIFLRLEPIGVEIDLRRPAQGLDVRALVVTGVRNSLVEDLGSSRPMTPAPLFRRFIRAALEQRTRERAQARPDFDDLVVGLWIERGDDALDVMAVDQEVLAEALACDVTAATPSSRG